MLGACARSDSVSTLWEGKQVHGRIVKHGFVTNLLVQTTLLHFYGSNRDVASARKLFDEMPVRSSPTWNAMLKGYSSHKEHAAEAVILFRDMLINETKPTGTTVVCVLSAASRIEQLETGSCIHGFVEKTIQNPTQDVFIGTDLINMYSKCGSLDSALAVFKEMETRNVLTWTAMTSGLAVHGRGKEALELLVLMEFNGFCPNEVTFTSLLSACCHGGLVEEGLHLFHHMKDKFGISHTMQHYGCIVDLLGKAGKLEVALEFIECMEIKPDLILWRSLLSSCNLHGDVLMAEKVGKLLLQMEKKKKGSDGEDFVALSNVYASMEKWKEVEMVRKEMKVRGIEAKHGSSFIWR